jgi:hypothetical protein
MSAEQDWAVKNRKRFKNHKNFIATGAKRFGMSHRAFRNAVRTNKTGGFGSGTRRREAAVVAVAGFSRAGFGATLDPDTKIRVTIRNALARLETDTSFDGDGNPVRDSIWADADFRHKLCRLSAHNWKQIVDEDEFLKFQFEMRGKRYWALPHTLKDYVFKELPLAQEVTL